jgi:hypothetical protein
VFFEDAEVALEEGGARLVIGFERIESEWKTGVGEVEKDDVV